MKTFFARNSILIMNNNKIDVNYTGGYAKWIVDNDDMIVTNIIAEASTCTHPKTIVELGGFDNPKDQLAWLRNNSGFICFDESNIYIEGSHSVSILRSAIDNQITEKITNLLNGDTTAMNAYKISLKDLLDKFSIDLDKYDYEKVLLFQLKKKANGYEYELNIEPKDNLVDGNVYYSFPFLRSILKNNDIKDKDNCYFYFAGITVNGVDSIGFKVDYLNNNLGGFYDYSTIPGTGGGTGGGGMFIIEIENVSDKKNYI